MGSTPTVDGGMTEEQYRKLQLEERQFQAELEEQAFARAEESEARRLETEQANKERLAAQENAEKAAIQQSELQLQGEIAGLDEEEREDNMGAIDFYGALSEGQSKTTDNARPEGHQ